MPCVIAPGFQGITTDNRFTTLGRGGSDLTAILLASLFEAEVVEFYKDVPGVMSGDPKNTKNVYKLPSVSYQKLQNLCETATHPLIQKKAVDMAAKHHIPLHIRPFGSSEEGTWIKSTAH